MNRDENHQKLGILTLNIWHRSQAYEQRLALMHKQIAALSPDIIGLQEVLSDGSRSLADDVGGDLGYQAVFGAAKEFPGGISFGNAILSRWPITNRRVFALPDGKTDEQRSVVLVDVETPRGIQPFASTHLAWKFHHGFVREAQVAAIAEIFQREFPIDERKLPPILVGDLNARPESTEIRFLSGLHALNNKSIFLADCFDEVGEGPGYTFDGRRNPFAAYTHEAPRRIDYVFVRGPDRLGRGKPLAARVVLDELQNGIAASDHFGVYAELST